MSGENEKIILQKLSHIEAILEEQERRQQLELKIEEMLCRFPNNSTFTEIQPFKKGILSFLIDNANLDLIYNLSDLNDCVQSLFYIFKGTYGDNLYDYCYLQAHLRTTDNMITEKLRKTYGDYEKILMQKVKKDLQSQGKASDDEEVYKTLYIMLDTIKEDELMLFSEIERKAIEKIQYIRSAVDINLSTFLNTESKTHNKRPL